ncbi:MAG: hypothetical protein ACLR6O_04045 [Eubacterium sp.]
MDCYTKAGVRGLEEQISNLCRKAATARRGRNGIRGYA